MSGVASADSALEYCTIGPGVLIASKDIRVLRRLDNCITVSYQPKNCVTATFPDAAAAKIHFDLMVLELQKVHRFVPIFEDFLITRDHVQTMYHKASYENGWRGVRKYAGEKAIILFNEGLYIVCTFKTNALAVVWLDEVIKRIQKK